MSPTSDTAHGGRRLVIVESPAKAKTIKGYLGPGYVVEASVGHIRDLPNGAAEVPEKYTGEVRRLGVDVEHDFQPIYVVNADKKAQVKKLKDLLKDSDELFLATDEDREGEAIAWHLLEVLKPKVPVHRMVFHEITKDAIRSAVANPRELNQRMVDAQETRRILDRLYGYEVSPVLWKKVMPRLSAGRVQSVATRLVVERERERIAFRSAEYWDLTGTFGTGRAGDASDPSSLVARLATVDGKRVAQGRDFDSLGQLKSANTLHLDETNARALATALENTNFAVRSVESKPYRRSPYAPFRTTTLQQEASRKLGFGRRRPCRWRRSCTRTASSPTCVRTPRPSRTRRSPRPVPRSRSCTAPTTCRRSRARTPGRSRTRRRRTRRSAPRVIVSAPRPRRA
ncbi:hypothetical protein SAV31267_046020 [Streptomyces avermitilis]|uniref:Omega-protein n=1 Tax=Streptomyces avermitilis TaxID=33903 RepID=A0A4D4MVL3_STRAX|nr:hypothetical protein SAV31267_046020 [Streptomyces avermitilis]